MDYQTDEVYKKSYLLMTEALFPDIFRKYHIA